MKPHDHFASASAVVNLLLKEARGYSDEVVEFLDWVIEISTVDSFHSGSCSVVRSGIVKRILASAHD